MIPKQLQYTYKKVIGFTEDQHKTLVILDKVYNVNVNKFMRVAFKEKLKRDFPKIKAERERFKSIF